MKLRDHPLMIRKNGFKTWPPLWTTTVHDETDQPTGEIGTLEEVLMHELVDNKIFLFIEFQALRYMGHLSFDDARFCSDIYILLKSNLSVSIKEIGDIELSPSQRQPAMMHKTALIPLKKILPAGFL